MIKIINTINELRLGITLSIFLLILSTGYAQSPYSSDELIIRFESSTSPAYIDSLRMEYNAYEDFSISPSPITNIHLWHITVFPAGGNNDLNDINEVIGDARGRAEVNSAGLNYSSLVFSFDANGQGGMDPTLLCPNFSISNDVADTEVRMAILDTGIGYYADPNSGNTFYSQELFDPFYGSYIGYDYANQDPHPIDGHGHGTHIAGIIAEIATMSVANSIEMESYKTHDDDGVGKIYDIILAVDESIINNIDIINMSFSYQAPPPSEKEEPLEHAINVAGSHGILVVAAAGNDSHNNDLAGEPNYPASFDCNNIISVASVACGKDLSAFSNYGKLLVDVATLGEAIIAPDHIGNIVAKSGTSQAAAITSGVAGILATNLSSVHWSPIKCSIMDGAEYKLSLEDLMITEGLVNAYNSYNELMTGDCGIGYRSMPQEEEVILTDLNEVFIYPNPFSESCNFKYIINTPETIVVNIYNGVGQLVFNDQKTLGKGTHIFNWSSQVNIPTGIYYIQILTNDKEVTRKVVKQY